MKYKLIIFDFDGTLANSFPWVLEAIDRLAEKYGFKKVERNELDKLRSLDARQVMKKYAVSPWKTLSMARDIRSWMA
ncbi:MAG: HAD hydrolase-like protein, partial [Chloroflexi bacterium]|nr:HAD hydrolase-like protein [Chloroflexota bacterium]